MANSKNVLVSVESLLDQEIEEISRTGEETYVKPLTPAEELKLLTQKIDFESSIKDEYNADQQVKEENKADDKSQGVKWPWENVQRSLRTALSELGILADVLQVVSSRKYVVLDHVSQPQEPPKPTVQMLGKKKALKKASEVISKGAQQMIAQQSASVAGDEKEINTSNYYKELIKLRRSWKLKRSANNAISGDLSYRNDGSSFWHHGIFEVKKQEDVYGDSQEAVMPLNVRVPADLEGYSQLIVSIITKSNQITNRDSILGRLSSNQKIESGDWHSQLKQAQYNLFCKEIFTQLAREAYHENVSGFDQVSENCITMQLFEGVTLSLRYTHRTEDKVDDREPPNKKPCDRESYSIEMESLSLRLHELLLRQHKEQFELQPPQPSTSHWIPKSARAPTLCNMLSPNQEKQNDSLCSRFLKECCHRFLKSRVNEILVKVQKSFKDPKLSFNWTRAASHTNSSVTLHLLSSHNTLEHRTSLYIEVKSHSLRIVCVDGAVLELGYDAIKLEKVISNQINFHLCEAAAMLLDLSCWRITLKKSEHDSMNGIKISCLTSRSEKTQRSLHLRVQSPDNVDVAVTGLSCDEEDNIRQLFNDTLISKACHWRKVDWLKLPGKTFFSKFVTLMTLLEVKL